MNNEFDTKEYIFTNDDNEIIEITEDDYKEDLTSFEQEVIPHDNDPLELMEERVQEKELAKKKDKNNFKKKWGKYSNKKKALIIIVCVLLLLGLAVGIYHFMKPDDEVEKEKEEQTPIIEKDNYKYENGTLILLDKEDNEIGKYECKNKDENKCRVAYQNNEDNFDEEKYIYENGEKLKFVLPIINNTYAFIYDDSKESNGMIFFYDITKKEVVENYNSIKYYNINDAEYLVIENDESKYGLFQLKEDKLEKLIDYKYDYIGIKENEMIDLSYIVVKKDGKYLVADKNGKEISKKISNNIKSFNKKYIVTEDNGDYTISDYRNNKIVKNTYNYIILQENYFVGVKENTKVVVMDYNEKILQNNEIIIPNEYYNKTYIYDTNNNLIDTKEAFWVLPNNESVTIEYYKNDNDVESKVIYIYEGLVSQNYDYISYYEGVLYIYDDENKNTLLGTYSCSNKNNINNLDSIYENCYIAMESNFSANEMANSNKNLGYLPVINKRFIFINDTIDKNSQNIILYDLKDKKALGTYLSIDAGLYDGKTSLSFLNNSNLKVIGKSARKNKFGVISITNNEVTSVLSMDYDSLERIGEYFEVENAGGTYQLYNYNGEAITEPVGNKIINYVNGYIKTTEGDNYSIYSFDLKQSKKDLNYLELKSKFFVTIDEAKKISIYNYSDFSTPIVDSYPLETEEYKYTYQYTSEDYGVVVIDEKGEKVTLSLTNE